MLKKDYEKENRKRLRNILNQVKKPNESFNWDKQVFAVGGLTDIGFSRTHTNLLLVISSNGRGIFDCENLERIERDYDDSYLWFDATLLQAKGFGVLEHEIIQTGGLYGGGLPTTNIQRDSIEIMGLDWPYFHIILEENGGSVYNEQDYNKCTIISREDTLKAYGFSYCGNYIAIASSSDIMILKRKK